MHDWQVNKKRTCAQPVKYRAMPENEIPPAMRVDFYSIIKKRDDSKIITLFGGDAEI